MKKIVFCFILVFTALTSVQAQQEEDIVTLYNQAQMAADMGDYDEAISIYKQVLALNPQFVKGYLALGNVYIKKGQDISSLENAIRYFSEYLRLAPNAEDAVAVKTSLDRLEYVLARNLRREKAREFLQGRWATPAIETSHRRSEFIFDVKEIDNKIIFEVETSSLLYSSGFVDKRVYVDDPNANEYLATFTSEQVYQPSAAKRNANSALIGMGASFLGGGIIGELSNTLGQYLNDASYEKDVAKKIQTVYELKINPVPDELQELTCTIRMRLREISTTTKTLKDSVFFSKLHKVHSEYRNTTPIHLSSFWLEPYEAGSEVQGSNAVAKYKLKHAPDKEISKLYINGKRLQYTGGYMVSFGIIGVLGALTYPLTSSYDPNYDRELISYLYKIGGSLCVVGIPFIVIGNQKIKASVSRYNNAWDAATSPYSKPRKTSEIKIGFTEHGVGLAFVF